MAVDRRSRGVVYPALSDPLPRLPASYLTTIVPVRRFQAGFNSGRNLMALFGTDNVPRTRYPLRVEGGRSAAEFPQLTRAYPSSDTVIPMGTSLNEIIRDYPLHVWGTGLRLFLAEGWGAQRVYNQLAQGVRRTGAKTRPWNYIQQAYGREARLMADEQAAIDANAASSSEESLPSETASLDREFPRTRQLHHDTTQEQPHANVIGPPILDPAAPQLNLPYTAEQLENLGQEFRSLIEQERRRWLVADLAVQRLVSPGFTQLSQQEQDNAVTHRVMRTLGNWEQQLMQILGVEFHALITVQHVGYERELQILRAILDESPEGGFYDPVQQRQQQTTVYHAYLRLLNQIRVFRQRADNRLVSVLAEIRETAQRNEEAFDLADEGQWE